MWLFKGKEKELREEIELWKGTASSYNRSAEYWYSRAFEAENQLRELGVTTLPEPVYSTGTYTFRTSSNTTIRHLPSSRNLNGND